MTTDPTRCERCDKPTAMCICDRIEAHTIRTRVLILQHPQEQDKDLNTAPILTLTLPSAERVVGLSWPSLSEALGRDAQPSAWGVLYPKSLPRVLDAKELALPSLVLTRNGERRMSSTPLEGIIAIDGTWSQAKTLWWRNAWLLKLNRVVLHPTEPSIYGRMRRQPSRGAISTLEAVGEALVANGEPEAVRTSLRRTFRTMMQRARDIGVTDRDEPEAPGED